MKANTIFVTIFLLASLAIVSRWLINSLWETTKTTDGYKSEKSDYTPPLPPPFFVTTKRGTVYFIKESEIWIKEKETEKQLTFDGGNKYKKSFLSLSPQEEYLAYFQDLPPKEGLSNDEYYWHNYTTLRLVNLTSGEIKEIYRGSFKVGDYEWLSETEISIGVGCGTECSYLEIVDVLTKNKRQLMYGVGYDWSPNKKYVFAYHYAIAAGITIGDKFSRELFTIKREYPQNAKWFSGHKAAWSFDSTKLALVINKDGEIEMELLVFDAEKGFKTVLQKNLGARRFLKLGWDKNDIVYYETDGGITKIKI